MSMKKLAIALSMFALAGSITFAKAPIINGVPDIVIGDDEGGTLTLDTNWFRSVDAFNVLNYVTDVDSAQSDLLFAFFEQTTDHDDIGVRIDAVGATPRTATQIDPADRDRPANWGTNEITNYGQATRDYLLTFVDLVRSPEPYGNINYPDPLKLDGTPAGDTETVDLPWHNTQGASTLSGSSRLVWLYAADDELAGVSGPEPTRVTCDAMNIISRNYAFDALQGGISSVSGANFNFANGAGTTGNATMWTYAPQGGYAVTSGAAAGSGGFNGYLSMTAAVSGGSNGLGIGRWATKDNLNGYEGAINYVDPGAGPSLIYCARFTMSQNQTPSGSAPQIRLGVYESQFLNYVMTWVKPIQFQGRAANPQVPDAGQLQTYKIVWSANETHPDFAAMNWASGDLRTFNAFFDILDQYQDQGGTWTLYNVDVVTAPRPADLAAPSLSYSDFDAAGWTLDVTAGTAITYSHDATTGAMTINDGGMADNSAVPLRMWKRNMDKALVHWTDNQLLRFKVALSCPTTTDRSNFHWFRLRQNTAGFNVGQEWAILGDDGGVRGAIGGALPYVPPTTPFVYETYMASQVDDPNHDWTLLNTNNYDVISVALDSLGNQKITGNPGMTTHQLPTHLTVHSVAVEVLADSL